MASKPAKKQNPLRANFLKYWNEHPNYTAFVHTCLGIGLGILLQSWVEAGYINAIGWLLVLFGVVGHFYAYLG